MENNLKNTSIIESKEVNGVKFEIIQYNKLSGSDDIDIATALYFAKESGIRLKQVKITLNESEITTEAGALHFMKGNIFMESKVGGASGLAKKIATKLLTDF